MTAHDDELVVVEGESAHDDELPEPPDTAVAATTSHPDGASLEALLEDAVADLERVSAERDEYLDLARRERAELENYRRRVESQRAEQVARAAEQLVVELLPVLDTCEAAIGHGAADVEPIHSQLYQTLAKLGLHAIDEVDVPFDPNVHDAVMSEAGDDDGPVVVEVLRTGFSWNGRIVRPAMVKVRG